MTIRWIFAVSLISLMSLSVFSLASEARSIEGPIAFRSVSIKDIIENVLEFNNTYVSLYGYYNKSHLCVNKTSNICVAVEISKNCREGGEPCSIREQYATMNGLFLNGKLLTMFIFYGKKDGEKCYNDSECQGICLRCPGMKMILPGYIKYRELPVNAKTINFIARFGFEVSNISVIVIENAPDYGYCIGASLQPFVDEKHREEVRRYYIENGILEEDDPLGWPGIGYCIGVWENSKFILRSPKPEDLFYLDWLKEALLEMANEDYIRDHMRLLEFEISDGRLEFLLNYTVGYKSFRIKYLLKKSKNKTEFIDNLKSIQRIREIENIIPEEDAINTIKNACCDPDDFGIFLDPMGVIKGVGGKKVSENLCKWGIVDMESGRLLECKEGSCSLYLVGEKLHKKEDKKVIIYVLIGLLVLIPIVLKFIL